MLIKKIIIVFALIIFLISCGSEQKIKPKSNTMLLAQALSSNNFSEANRINPLIRKTENIQNIIKLYEVLYEEQSTKLNNELNYISQFYPQMNDSHKVIVDEIKIWANLMQIYKYEISPPVRILQREVLYLAPSNIDFSTCPNSSSTSCATNARSDLSLLLTNETITDALKQMAKNDPCVNLSNRLQGEKIANRCLKKSKSNLEIILLPLPRYNTNQWLEVLNSDIKS